MAEIPSPRLRLEEWGRILPALWRAVEHERAARKPDAVAWPSPVFLPLERAAAATLAAIAAKGDEPPAGPAELSPAACTTQCLATWRMTQGIYRIDPTLYEALITTPVTGDIPADILHYLPEWCVYVETPGMTAPTRGAAPAPVLGLWYWLDQAPGRDLILCIGLDLGRAPPLFVQHVPLVGTIEQAVAATVAEWADAAARGNAIAPAPADYPEAARAWLPPALSLVLYLCSRSAEIAGPRRPANPAPTPTRRHGGRLFPAAAPTVWELGVRLGAALRAAASTHGDGGHGDGGHHPAPHVRGAHWHTYLLGPRKEVPADQRRRDVRWMPPIPVGLADYDALVPTVHRVRLEPDP